MSIFPAGFDPRAEVVRALPLVSLDTPDGTFGFIIGTDGRFTDASGFTWHGSQLIQPGENEYAVDGKAPSGQIGMAFFQDPAAPELVSQVRALGADYVTGRAIRFWLQPFGSLAEMSAPVFAPVLVMTRTMQRIITRAEGGQKRLLAVTYESAEETREQSRRLIWNATDHAPISRA